MNVNIKLPTTWNELSEKQLKEICHAMEVFKTALELYPESRYTQLYSRLYVQLVKNLLRDNNFLKVWIALRQIPPEEYREYVKFILEGSDRTSFLPAFKLKGKRYHPPMDRLQNVSMKEFSFVDAAYYRWKTTGKEAYLNHLCAALYRPEGGNELDIRKPFNKVLVDKEMDAFARLDKKKKLAIAYTYEGCRNYIVSLYPTVFPPAPKEKNGKKTKPQAYTAFAQLLMHKINFDTSKFERTQNLNTHEFLGIYENELKEQKRHEANA